MKFNRKIILRVVVIIMSIIAIGITGMYIYVSTHKKELLAMVEDEFNNSYNGSLNIKDIEPDLWEQFPNISIALREVVIRDDKWSQHHIDFLNAKNIYIKLQFLPLLIGKVKMSKLIISDAQMSLFEDAHQLSNKDIFSKVPDKKKEGKNNLHIKHFELNRVSFRSTHALNKKHFEFFVHHMAGSIDRKKGQSKFHTYADVLVKQFCFNTDKGSYFRNKNIKMNVVFYYDAKEKILRIHNQTFNVNKYAIQMTGEFYLDKADNKFDIVVGSRKVDYKEGLTWLPQTVKQTLDSFMFEKPINFSMHIEGKLKNQRIPYVSISSNFRENNLDSKIGQFDSCTFKLVYVNGNKKKQQFGDQYSFIRLDNVTALYYGIPLHADTVQIYNVKKTYIKTHVKSVFKLDKLNNLFKGRSFQFGKGEAQLDIEYEGGMKKEDGYPTNISGRIGIKNGELSYLPRQLKFHDCNVFLQIRNNEIQVVESILHSQKSTIMVSAESKNFISLYRNRPGDIVIDATVLSDKIDLNEFQTFLQKRSRVSAEQNQTKGNQMPDFVDEALDVSKTNVDIKVKEVIYKKFVAKDINAKITLLQDGINFHNVSLRQSGGLINMTGAFSASDTLHPRFQIEASIQQAAIDQLLYSFDNFGQRSFDPENLKGTINIKSKLSGLFDANARLIPYSIKGSTSFEISKGALISFKPLIRLGRMVFRKDRLEHISFERIKNTLTIEGNKIQIPPMWVNSDLIDFQIQGVYNLNIGTDVLIEIPLFKFTKEDIAEDPELRKNPGYRLYIRGKDNEHGDLKFSLKMRNSEISAAREERRKNKELRKQRKQKRARQL